MAHAIPVPVQRSYLCWVAASVVHLLGTVVYVVVSYGIADALPVSPDVPLDAGAFYDVALVAIAVVGLVFAVLTVWFAARMRAGKVWARITLTVFGAIFGMTNIGGMLGNNGLTFNGEKIDSAAGTTVSIITAAVTLLLLVGAMILQWLPAAGPHFAPRFPPPYPQGPPFQQGPPYPPR